ncbi:IDEAL domain-containing protein [Oceanobacillus profundus]|uniref:IDEAL domain-containing protein n=1 Tax=Oceanobacillus TaxID=182709 RepID=UPI0026E332E8|nr:IDEAL domain-containing protein [Oceanobacillus profundus]MDO6449572.1 IDEAL domain-containing protein [Oceanobacillus profundus]
MVTVKMLKPYYIKTEEEYVRVILAYQYFSVVINKKVYQFIPVEANEIRINRKTKKVENLDAVFAFQNGKDVVNVTMSKLISIPDFLQQLHSIAETYYQNDDANIIKTEQEKMTLLFIREMERENVKKLIDIALDKYDEDAFYKLTKLL